jgi:hypothetical protein
MEHCKLGRKTILESDSLRKIGYCEEKRGFIEATMHRIS